MSCEGANDIITYSGCDGSQVNARLVPPLVLGGIITLHEGSRRRGRLLFGFLLLVLILLLFLRLVDFRVLCWDVRPKSPRARERRECLLIVLGRLAGIRRVRLALRGFGGVRSRRR